MFYNCKAATDLFDILKNDLTTRSKVARLLSNYIYKLNCIKPIKHNGTKLSIALLIRNDHMNKFEDKTGLYVNNIVSTIFKDFYREIVYKTYLISLPDGTEKFIKSRSKREVHRSYKIKREDIKLV